MKATREFDVCVYLLFCSLRGVKKCSFWDKWSQNSRQKMGAADRSDVCLGLYRVISWVPGLSSSVRLLNGQPTPASQ